MTKTQAKPGSVRWSIVEKSLDDTLERLRELPAGPSARKVRAKAQGYERALRAWSTCPPTEEQRGALLKLVLELNMEVRALGRAAATEASR
jgi:hypothetical protein